MKFVWCITILMVQFVACDQVGDDSKDVRRERSCVTPNGKRGICPPGSKSSSPPSASVESSTEFPTTPNISLSKSGFMEWNSDYADAFPMPPVCGVSQGWISRVADGNDANLGDFPWIAAIAHRNFDGTNFDCGGSLITSQHVLTAAHCIVGKEDLIYFVRLGEFDVTDHSQNQPVDSLVKTMIVHEQYNPNDNTNDVGILVLATPIIFTDLIRPICLPFSDELRYQDFLGYNPYVAGWGRTSFQGPQATRLQMLQLPVVTLESCKDAYSVIKFLVIDERIICAGGIVGKDACFGDSGGPLNQPIWDPIHYTTFFYQIGIVSYGMNCGIYGAPGLYTRVTEFLPWIQKHVLGTESI